MQALRQVQIDDLATSQFQTNVTNFVTPLLKNPMLDGTLLRDVTIGTADTQISHGLGRTPIGYVVAGKQGLGDIYQSQPSTNLFLTLRSSVQVVSHIWVY